ncbi:MAG: hypothetical protein ACRCU2_22705, partial [Planktothrix sp.]
MIQRFSNPERKSPHCGGSPILEADWQNETGLPDRRWLPGVGDYGSGSTSPGWRFPRRRMICMAGKPKWWRLSQCGGSRLLYHRGRS